MKQNFTLTAKNLEYYQSNAEKFFKDTVHIDLKNIYKPFLDLMPETGVILDAGCGSGRDTRFFMKQGFKVIAFDNSPYMVRLASDFTGQDCLVMSFEDMNFENKFHGIWACSSILHVPKNNMLNVLSRFNIALKNHGIIYASFKYGNTEEFIDGRYFSNYDENSFNVLLNDIQRTFRLNWKEF